ncbi:hypothetical protein EGI22_16370 [Lacihabitans sp. LS3-19]|uniref:hypothetical protein n=1 Tax=Lacihabitans sp. LS3-19 TaxID=2487335 RepID=UPI0020CF59FA|nr:hypothetical protein [Lacihabitans sp. LS3-19]MCP9769480.1 hypothetical protein [Lacihabitans sp. LS3-19]
MEEKTLNIVLNILLAGLFGLQAYGLYKVKSQKRWPIKVILNVLLLISIVLLIFPPKFQKNITNNKIGIKDERIPASEIKKLQDSLDIELVITPKDYLSKFIDKNPEIHLFGQSFTAEFLSELAEKNMHLHPYFSKNEIQDLSYQSILRQNENQQIFGKIELENKATIKVKYGSATLDSIILEKGQQSFILSFPSFSLGKTAVDIFLDDKVLSSIHYFSRKADKLNILILSENPDFETKTLSDWLGKNGHQVKVQTLVAKNTQNNTDINKTENEKYDIVFATPANISQSICKKTIANGGAIFMYNAEESAIEVLNKTYGTGFKFQKIGNEKEIQLKEGLFALPFKFLPETHYQINQDWPIAVNSKRIGTSLLSETYPLLLSGDSITYRKIWAEVLQKLNIVQKNNIAIQAPIQKDLNTEIIFNNFENLDAIFKTPNDSIFTKKLASNPNSYFGNYAFRKSGWQAIDPENEVFIDEDLESYLAYNFSKSAINIYQKNGISNTNISLKEPISPWVLFFIIFIILAMLWLEPKL